jgi:hypothetical protein
MRLGEHLRVAPVNWHQNSYISERKNRLTGFAAARLMPPDADVKKQRAW